MDASAAVASLLVDAGLADGRVWRPSMPQSEAATMPRRQIVVRRTGGGALTQAFMPSGDQRLDVRCYGSDAADAIDLERQVTSLMHYLRDVDTPYGRIMWCRLSGGASDQVEPQTSWPFTMTSWQVMCLLVDDTTAPS